MVLKSRSDIKTVEFDNIPKEMKQLNMWVLWKAEERTDKEGNTYFDKVPYQADGIKKASSTNSATWSTFQAIKEAHESGIGHGVGLVLNEDNSIYTLDIDGQTEHKFLEGFKEKTYCELSPSGNGVHVYLSGDKFKEFKKKVVFEGTELELYSTGRFMTVTGDQISDVNTVLQSDETIDYLIKTVFKPDDHNTPLNTSISDLGTSRISKDEVIAKVTNNQNNGVDMSLILNGNWEQARNRAGEFFPSQSESDMALMNVLAFYSNGDREMMLEIWRESQAYREHKDHKNGGIGKTAETAINSLRSTYNPEYSNEYGIEAGTLYGEELEKVLKKMRAEEFERIEIEWEAGDKKGRKPTTIHPLRCAMLLKNVVKFNMADHEENTRLSMYLADEGIYTLNMRYIKKLISILEPKHNSFKADDVIYHLKNMTGVEPLTEKPHLIPVGNGIYNNKTKELEPFTPDYVFTSKVATNYVKDAQKPIINGWDIDEWFKEIACNDKEVVKLLWQVVNDSINGNYTRKKAIILIGEGLNGKGTFQELIANLVGMDNVATLKLNEFDERFKLSMLQGKTVAIGDDVPAHVYVDDSSNFNSVVTGDMVSVEMKNKPAYSTRFRCTVIQSTNGLPRFKNKSNGTLRRFLIVPFKAQFTPQTDDYRIKEEYIQDKQLLEYVLKKAIEMDFVKFDIPKVSEDALEDYKQDNDPIYEFKINVFDMWDTDTIPKQVVYKAYDEFCENNGYKKLSERKFHKDFKKYVEKEWTTDTLVRVNAYEAGSKLEVEAGYLGDFVRELDNSKRPYKSYQFTNPTEKGVK